MKIRKLQKENTLRPRPFTRESSSETYKVLPAFQDHLQNSHREMVQQELAKLFNDIEKQGNKLKESLNIRDVKKYRELIKKFLDYAVREMYTVNEHHGWDRRGRHKIYSMIETINKELENLTQMLLSQQKDPLQILSKIDEIRGMLIDIYS